MQSSLPRCALLVAALLLTACQKPTTTPDPITLTLPDAGVKLSDLAAKPLDPSTEPAAAPLQTPGVVTAEPPSPPLNQHVVVQVLVFPRPSPQVGFAANMIDAAAIPEPQRRVWNANGFGIGRVDRARLPLLMANLPAPLSVETANMRGIGHYSSLTLVDRILGQQRVRVIDATGRDNLQRLTLGKCQILFKLVPSLDAADAPPQLELLPHHYRPVSSLLPRTPDRTQLDGSSYTDLRFVQSIGRDEVWAIWLEHQPEPPAALPGAGDLQVPGQVPGEAPPELPTTGELEHKPAPTAEPISLADMFLTGNRRNKPVQIMLLIALTDNQSK